MSLRGMPFVRIVVPLIFGIISYGHFEITIPYVIPQLIILNLILFYTAYFQVPRKFYWIFGICIHINFFLIGYFLCGKTDEKTATDYFANFYQEEMILTGVVDDMPTKKEWIKIKLKLEKYKHKDSLKNCSGNLIVYIKKDSISEQLQYGDYIAFNSKVQEVPPPKNPNAFDYKRYLHFQNIHYQSFIKENEWRLLDQNRGNPLFTLAFGLRTKFLKILEKHLTSENELAVGSALILGYKNDLSEDVRAAYAETGAMHVLAVSGLHVGIIYLFLDFLLRWIYINRKWWKLTRLLINLFAIWAFALVTGASPSVLRAATMFTFIAYGNYKNKNSVIYNTLGVSAFVLLLINPYLIFQVGFQLSYLAVFGIVFFQYKIQRWFGFKNDILHHIWILTSVAIAAQLMVLPISLYYFHQFPVYFWMTGFVVVDAAFIVLVLGVLLIILEMTVPFLATYVGYLLKWILAVVNKFIFFVQELPFGLIEGVYYGAVGLLIMYLIVLAIGAYSETGNRKWMKYAYGTFIFFLFWHVYVSYDTFCEKQIVVYNIGKEKTVIDFIENHRVVSLVGGDISEKDIKYNIEGNRNRLGIREVVTIPMDSIFEYKDQTIHYKRPLVQFHGKRIAVLQKDVETPKEALEMDYVILRNSVDISIDKISEVFDYQQIIADASNSYWSVKEWKETCQEKEIDFLNIYESGAFVAKIE